MKTNLYNKPFSYRDIGQAKPGKQPEHPAVRVYSCISCGHPGGTLKNIGTHKEPRYIHPACQKKRDQRVAAGRQSQ